MPLEREVVLDASPRTIAWQGGQRIAVELSEQLPFAKR
jgi:hypothetical protein